MSQAYIWGIGIAWSTKLVWHSHKQSNISWSTYDKIGGWLQVPPPHTYINLKFFIHHLPTIHGRYYFYTCYPSWLYPPQLYPSYNHLIYVHACIIYTLYHSNSYKLFHFTEKLFKWQQDTSGGNFIVVISDEFATSMYQKFIEYIFKINLRRTVEKVNKMSELHISWWQISDENILSLK